MGSWGKHPHPRASVSSSVNWPKTVHCPASSGGRLGCEEMTGAGGAELGEPSLALVGLPSTARVFILNSSSPKSHSKFLPSEMIEATVVFICQLFCPLLSRVNPRVSLCLLESTTLSQPPFCTDEPRSISLALLHLMIHDFKGRLCLSVYHSEHEWFQITECQGASKFNNFASLYYQSLHI